MSLGYHGTAKIFNKISHDGIVGPTTGHAGITESTYLTSADSGKVITVTQDTSATTAEVTIILPTASPGLIYTFVVLTEFVVSGGEVKIITNSSTELLMGNVFDGPSAIETASTTSRAITFDNSVNTERGDHVTLQSISDTLWFINGQSQSAGSLVFTDT